jgi:hypothetical protein
VVNRFQADRIILYSTGKADANDRQAALKNPAEKTEGRAFLTTTETLSLCSSQI